MNHSSNLKTNSFKTYHQKPIRHISNDEEQSLRFLFSKELQDIYWAEKALTKAIPVMIKNANSEELIQALIDHLEETKEHIARLEQVFFFHWQQNSGKKNRNNPEAEQ